MPPGWFSQPGSFIHAHAACPLSPRLFQVVDKQALLDTLDGGRLAGVGLDVHWMEPADPSEPLYRHPKVRT